MLFRSDTTETYKFQYVVRNNPFIGLEELEASNVLLYPNPNTGAFTINLEETQDVLDVTVISMDGRIVYQQTHKNKQSIDLNLNLPNGNYAVVLSSQKINGSYPLVIQRD